MIEAAHILVSGLVQGVGYRAWTERLAKELRLSGWVRNLADERVEIVVEGERAVLDDFIERCKSGPRNAQVENVAARAMKAGGARSFSIQRTAAEPLSS